MVKRDFTVIIPRIGDLSILEAGYE